MTRSIIREHIFKILFRAEFYNKEELIQQTDYYVSELSSAKDKEIEYIKDKTLAIIDKLSEIDEIMKKYSYDRENTDFESLVKSIAESDYSQTGIINVVIKNFLAVFR